MAGLPRGKEGDIFGIHDLGLTSWTIRWKSAGWSNRDNMAIWSHCGFLYGGSPWAFAHMLNTLVCSPGAYYTAQPGDNPGVTSVIRPYVMSLTYGGTYFPGKEIFRALINAALAGPKTKYDLGTLLSGFFGIPEGLNADKDYICTEFVWNVMVGVERFMGMRVSGPLKYMDPNGYYHTVYGDAIPSCWAIGGKIPYSYFSYTFEYADCFVNTYSITNCWTPYLMQTRHAPRSPIILRANLT
jgi:hypothetical protein